VLRASFQNIKIAGGGGDLTAENGISGIVFVENAILNFHGKDADPVNVQTNSYTGPVYDGINFAGWGTFWAGRNCIDPPVTESVVNAKQSANLLSHYIDKTPSGSEKDKTDNLPDVTGPSFVGYS